LLGGVVRIGAAKLALNFRQLARRVADYRQTDAMPLHSLLWLVVVGIKKATLTFKARVGMHILAQRETHFAPQSLYALRELPQSEIIGDDEPTGEHSNPPGPFG